MKVFSIHPDGGFSEYVRTPFQVDHEESVLEGWLEFNADGLLEDGRMLVIGRQVVTNLGGFIDLLGLDREGNVVVVELKRDRTPRETMAQALEYASFAERLDMEQLEAILRTYLNDESLNLAEYHRAHFNLGSDEAVAFNKDQRIVVVGQRVAPEIRQTSSYLRSKGIRTTCVEFTFFRDHGGTRLLTQEIVIGTDGPKQVHVSTGSLPVVTEEAFLASCDENGKAVFARILQLSKVKGMPLHWGTKGFSLNVDVGGTHVAVCFVYPPDSVYRQTLRTAMRDIGGVTRKSAVAEDRIAALWRQAEATGLFVPAGRDLKCRITRPLTEQEIESLVRWCESVEAAVREYGLKQ